MGRLTDLLRDAERSGQDPLLHGVQPDRRPGIKPRPEGGPGELLGAAPGGAVVGSRRGRGVECEPPAHGGDHDRRGSTRRSVFPLAREDWGGIRGLRNKLFGRRPGRSLFPAVLARPDRGGLPPRWNPVQAAQPRARCKVGGPWRIGDGKHRSLLAREPPRRNPVPRRPNRRDRLANRAGPRCQHHRHTGTGQRDLRWRRRFWPGTSTSPASRRSTCTSHAGTSWTW